MSRYAERTSVTSEKSRAEVERTLQRYGAKGFSYGWMEHADGLDAALSFIADGRQVRFRLPMPDPKDREFTHTPSKQLERHPDDAHKEWEQACRQRWRALALVVKAKLEAVEAGIVSFEDEFMAHIVLPTGQTVGEWGGPQIAAAYESGEMPPLMPGVRPELVEGEVVEEGVS